jgi:hypothetical protein
MENDHPNTDSMPKISSRTDPHDTVGAGGQRNSWLVKREGSPQPTARFVNFCKYI